jgi:hypothetical protein
MPVVPAAVGLKVATNGVAPGVIVPIGLVCTHSTFEIAVPGAGVRTNPIVSSRSITSDVVDMVFENKGTVLVVLLETLRHANHNPLGISLFVHICSCNLAYFMGIGEIGPQHTG